MLASLFNSLAIGVFGAAFIIPIAQRRYDVFSDGGGLLLLGGVCFHLGSQIAIRFIRAED